ncbi:Uncharacterised protein [Burkholderia pseudomallei]|nr:Uncharacterised protein [Burkholderia pseudomallei]
MSRISRCGETRGIPHGKTPALSPSRARDDERGGRRARPSPKRGARARAGSSPVHRRFIAGSSPIHRRFMAGSWLVHGRVTRARRDAGGRGRLPQNRPGADRRPDDAGRRAAPAERIRRTNASIELAGRTHRSNSSITLVGRTHRPNMPIELAAQIRRSHLPVEHTDRTRRSNTPTKLAARRDRATASRLAAPASPPDSGRPAAASRSARRRSRTPRRA